MNLRFHLITLKIIFQSSIINQKRLFKYIIYKVIVIVVPHTRDDTINKLQFEIIKILMCFCYNQYLFKLISLNSHCTFHHHQELKTVIYFC